VAGKIYRARVHLPGAIIGVADAPAADPAVRISASPNPFNPTVIFSIHAERALRAARVVLVDAHGRLVRELVAGDLAPRPAEVQWDGRDGAGRPAASGAYAYRLVHADGATAGKTIILLK
jgi:hypothetical protein